MPRRTETVDPIDLNDLAGPATTLPEEDVPAMPDTPKATSAQVPMRKSLVPELYRFVRSLPADAPYHELVNAAVSAGWIWKLTEDTCYKDDDQCVVRFRVEIGKATNDLELEYFDHISLMVPKEAPSPSLFARANAATTLIYMVFGRLPPMPQQAPASQPVIEQEEAPRPERRVPWQEEAPAEPKPIPNVVLRRTPDGLPLLLDLYSEEGSPDDLIAGAFNAFEEAIDSVGTQAALTALWGKNAQAVEFIKDFGSDGDKARLANMFKNRAKELRN